MTKQWIAGLLAVTCLALGAGCDSPSQKKVGYETKEAGKHLANAANISAASALRKIQSLSSGNNDAFGKATKDVANTTGSAFEQMKKRGPEIAKRFREFQHNVEKMTHEHQATQTEPKKK